MSFFVYDTPRFGYQVAGGFTVRKTLLETFKMYPSFTIEEALDGASYNSTAIWEPWTVQMIQSLLLFAWLSVFGFISLLCSSFLLLQEKVSKPWGEATSNNRGDKPKKEAKAN
jgi:hypothetical protein